MGGNSYRTSHYPYAEEIMDFADQNGIVIIGLLHFLNSQKLFVCCKRNAIFVCFRLFVFLHVAIVECFRWVSCGGPWPLWCSSSQKSPAGKSTLLIFNWQVRHICNIFQNVVLSHAAQNTFGISDDDRSGGSRQEQVRANWLLGGF